jgi:hypothetical protein
LKGAAQDFKPAADHNFIEARYCHGIFLITGDSIHRNIPDTFRYLNFSDDNGSIDGKFLVAGMPENRVRALSCPHLDIPAQKL